MMTDNLQLVATTESGVRQPYTKPAVIHELKLETRAGTPNRPGLPDPLGIDPTNPQGN
jgi:hypothetical protein